jgi:CheY-like chemotaxis protein
LARGPRVFVIDDDPAIRRLLRQLLTTAGYRVAEAAPSQDAFLRLAERKFDLLLLDIDEPAGIRSDPIGIVRDLSPMPILALSVHTDEAAAAWTCFGKVESSDMSAEELEDAAATVYQRI